VTRIPGIYEYIMNAYLFYYLFSHYYYSLRKVTIIAFLTQTTTLRGFHNTSEREMVTSDQNMNTSYTIVLVTANTT